MTQTAQNDRASQFSHNPLYGEATSRQLDAERIQFRAKAEARYRLEPSIPHFAKFHEARGKRVLEIGVGTGVDHGQWALHKPAALHGIDLSQHAIDRTAKQLQLAGLQSNLQKADAEKLPFATHSFDIVYSWGVLHQCHDTARAFREAYRVLDENGVARFMIYNKWSLTGFLLWARYSLSRGRFTEIPNVYAHRKLKTKPFTIKDATRLCHLSLFADVNVRVQLCSRDMLERPTGKWRESRAQAIIRGLWPRRTIKRLAPKMGLFLLIEASKRSYVDGPIDGYSQNLSALNAGYMSFAPPLE